MIAIIAGAVVIAIAIVYAANSVIAAMREIEEQSAQELMGGEQ